MFLFLCFETLVCEWRSRVFFCFSVICLQGPDLSWEALGINGTLSSRSRCKAMACQGCGPQLPPPRLLLTAWANSCWLSCRFFVALSPAGCRPTGRPATWGVSLLLCSPCEDPTDPEPHCCRKDHFLDYDLSQRWNRNAKHLPGQSPGQPWRRLYA